MAASTETTWSYDILDFSPLVIYSATTSNSPAIVPGLVSAWQQACPTGNSSKLGDTICDLSSTHTTSTSGASVTIPFYGQGIQLFGSVAGGMSYQVTLDNAAPASGNVTSVSGNTLAHLTNLAAGEHTVTVSAQPGSQSGATLSFTSATVEVGTGLTGATVTRQILQDDDTSIDYIGPSAWSVTTFDAFGIPHSGDNTSWHQVNAGTAGSLSFTTTGAVGVFIRGVSWSFFASDYQVSVDGGSPTLYYGNATLANPASMGSITADSLRYANAHLNGTHTFTVDNHNGVGELGIDYIELVSVTGGTALGASSASHASTAVTVTHAGATGTGGSSSPTASTGTHSSALSHRSNNVVGAAMSSVLGVFILLSLLFSWFPSGGSRQRKTKAVHKGIQQPSRALAYVRI